MLTSMFIPLTNNPEHDYVCTILPHTPASGRLFIPDLLPCFFFFEPRSNRKRFTVSTSVVQRSCRLSNQRHVVRNCDRSGEFMAVFFVWKMTRVNLKSSFSMLNINQSWSCLETSCIHQAHQFPLPTTGGAKGFSFVQPRTCTGTCCY